MSVFSYRPGDDFGELEFWAFDNPLSDYVIKRGDPKTYGRLDKGGTGYDFRLGIWRCTEGAIECNELGDELQSILSGKVRLIQADGSSEVYEAGDSFFTRQGDRVTWDVIEDVTKVFYATRDGGF